MSVFCDKLKLCSTAALDRRTGQNKGRYRKKELSFLLVLLITTIAKRLHHLPKNYKYKHKTYKNYIP